MREVPTVPTQECCAHIHTGLFDALFGTCCRRRAPASDAGAKAPLLRAYERAYLPKKRGSSAPEDDGEGGPCAAPHAAAAPRFAAAAPDWRDVLLTAAFMWLAGLGLLLIIAMARLAAHQVQCCVLLHFYWEQGFSSSQIW